jgi:hypothetical protein
VRDLGGEPLELSGGSFGGGGQGWHALSLGEPPVPAKHMQEGPGASLPGLPELA